MPPERICLWQETLAVPLQVGAYVRNQEDRADTVADRNALAADGRTLDQRITHDTRLDLLGIIAERYGNGEQVLVEHMLDALPAVEADAELRAREGGLHTDEEWVVLFTELRAMVVRSVIRIMTEWKAAHPEIQFRPNVMDVIDERLRERLGRLPGEIPQPPRRRQAA